MINVFELSEEYFANFLFCVVMYYITPLRTALMLKSPISSVWIVLDVLAITRMLIACVLRFTLSSINVGILSIALQIKDKKYLFWCKIPYALNRFQQMQNKLWGLRKTLLNIPYTRIDTTQCEHNILSLISFVTTIYNMEGLTICS